MDNYEKILVVLLSTALAVFLALGIIVLIKLIQVVNNVKHISEKAEQVADKAASIGATLQKVSSPFLISRFLTDMSSSLFRRSKKSEKSKKR